MFNLIKASMKEFKKFISRGNVIDMAVGLILATYFGAIVKSLVNDLLMPPLGMLIGGVDFSSFKFVIKQAQEGVDEVAINYGIFINHILTFLIVSAAIFIAVKLYNKVEDRLIQEEETKPTAPQPPSKEEVLLAEIRDLLKK
ncbi:MAG: large-conductance mechanosensitive channel protein MscL [Flavobacteriaceae bacterium]|jgi:large conductance mechanosensitive channel|nr:large-conductance mechanosensitive channel protein MscL [Flavobacteriaceae bacterium]